MLNCENTGATTQSYLIYYNTDRSMFIYIKKAIVNLVSTCNTKRTQIKAKFIENESTLAKISNLLISKFLIVFQMLENFSLYLY